MYAQRTAKICDKARLTIVIPDDVTKELRIRAVEVYDGKKGALGKAVTDAIRIWSKQPLAHEKKNRDFPKHFPPPPGVQIPTVPPR